MAQNAAAPIGDMITSGIQKLENYLGSPTKPAHEKVDEGYHSRMLKAANDSFLPKKTPAKKAARKPARKR